MHPMAAKPKPELDKKVALPLDPEEVLRGLLAVDPDSEPDDPPSHAGPDH